MPATSATAHLSQIDAFFVAYQEVSGILMQHGVEAELGAVFTEADLHLTIHRLVTRWPQLGMTIRAGVCGLSHGRRCEVRKLYRRGTDLAELAEFRNRPIDPFREPPLQVLWIPQATSTVLACRTHHAVADAEAMSAVCLDAMRTLAAIAGGAEVSLGEPVPKVSLAELMPWKKVRQNRRWLSMWKFMRQLARESRACRSAPMAVRSTDSGPIDSRECRLVGDDWARLKQAAARHQVSALMLCAAAWLRTVHAWNVRQGQGSNPLVSLEFPITLRRGRRDLEILGNYISPVILQDDGNAPIAAIAARLEEQLISLVGQRAHWGTPYFTAPGRYLPWWLFRRMAERAAASGFATTHFTWLEPPCDIRREMRELSHGAAPLLQQRVYTPVCRLMGAAIAGLAWPDQLQLFLTYRTTAFTAADADELIEMLRSEIAACE